MPWLLPRPARPNYLYLYQAGRVFPSGRCDGGRRGSVVQWLREWCAGCCGSLIIRYPVAVSECCTGISVVGQSSSMYFFLIFFLWALGPRRPRLGFGVLKDTFPIRWSPWARFLPVQLIRSAWQSAWHIPGGTLISPGHAAYLP